MARMGHGYGSEFHLLRFMGRHRRRLAKAILSKIDLEGQISWLDFGLNSENEVNPDSEWKGLDYLVGTHYSSVIETWKTWWPTTGTPPTWDAVGWLHTDMNGSW